MSRQSVLPGDSAEFSAEETLIPGLLLLQRGQQEDVRGSFSKLFDHHELTSLGWPSMVHQVNFSSTSRRGSIRGMHAQPGRRPEYKLVACARGTVWDVCLDLRRNSPTFLLWEAHELSQTNSASLLIPPGVAHGFQATSDDVELVYCHSAPYEPDSEMGVSPFDPLVGIAWPLEVAAVSDRDRNHKALLPTFRGILV